MVMHPQPDRAGFVDAPPHQPSRDLRFPRHGFLLAWIAVLTGLLLGTGCNHFDQPVKHSEARLIGALWWLSPADLDRPLAAWQAELDHLQALGINLLVLNGPFVSERATTDASDPLEALFTETDRRGVSIFVDTLAAPDWWLLQDPTSEIARARTRIATLARRYGHHASFGGWYIPYELYVMWDAQAELITTLYREISAACKQATPAKPVMISPFFILDRAGDLGDFRWATPPEYQQFWTTLLEQTRIDIVALQDSGEHLSCYTLDERRPFFAAMKSACESAGKTFWLNVEVGELHIESLAAYTNRFGRKTHVNDPRTAVAWRGVPAEKLHQKLALAGKYTDTAISWGYQQFVRPTLGPEAARLHETYRTVLSPGPSAQRARVQTP